MSTHTPGPWTAILDRDRDDGSDDTWYVLTAEEAAIAVGLYGPDARLIAAAPDLLDLAKDIAGLDHCYLAQGDKALQQALREWKAIARAAIAKAEGTS